MSFYPNHPNPQLQRDLNDLLDYAPQLWSRLHHARILLTGGTGFVGRWLVESALWAARAQSLNLHIDILTRHPQAFIRNSPHLAQADEIRLVQGDILNPKSLPTPKLPYTHVIHAAGEVAPTSSPQAALDTYRTLTIGTEHLLHHLTKIPACTPPRLVLISSGAFYLLGSTTSPFQESSPSLESAQAYAHGKLAAEAHASHYCRAHDIPLTVARLFTFIGPYLSLQSHYAISEFLRCALARDPITLRGHPATQRSYLYASEMALWLWHLALEQKSYHVYNIGSDKFYTMEQIASEVARLADVSINRSTTAAPSTSLSTTAYLPNIERITTEYGLRPRIALSEAIQRTLHFHRHQPALS